MLILGQEAGISMILLGWQSQPNLDLLLEQCPLSLMCSVGAKSIVRGLQAEGVESRWLHALPAASKTRLSLSDSSHETKLRPGKILERPLCEVKRGQLRQERF